MSYGSYITTQPHVEVHELELEKQRWNAVFPVLRKFCSNNNIGITVGFKKRPSEYKEDKILILFLFDRLHYNFFITFANDCKQHGKKCYIITDNWIDVEKFQHTHGVVYSKPELLSFTTLTNELYRPVTRSKLYNCFVHRVEPVRQSWFYFLYLYNLLNTGYVSFNLYQLDTDVVGKDLFEEIHSTHLSSLEKFNFAYDNLKDLVPFRNFQDCADLSEYILDSKYSLVLDTYAPEDNIGSYYASEKITRALQYPNVNLLFLQKGTLQKINQAGFYIDPIMLDVDSLGWIERQQKILELLKNNSVVVSENDLYEQAQNNRQIFKYWLQQCKDPTFFDEILDKILSD